jgi:hypothetical protein
MDSLHNLWDDPEPVEYDEQPDRPVIEARWPPSLVLDIALEAHDLDELLVKYDLTQEQLDKLYGVEQFRRELIHTRAELTRTGSSFRSHARVLAEAHLSTMNDLMNDPHTPAQTKMTIWQSFVKFAALEPEKIVAAPAEAPRLVIEIANFQVDPTAARAQIVDITPVRLSSPSGTVDPPPFTNVN